MVWNAQSMCNKLDEIIAFLFDNNIELAFISETWLSSQENTKTALLKSAGFCLTHCFREKRGGGVCILWHEKLKKRVKVPRTVGDFSTFQYQSILFHSNACWETFILPKIQVNFNSLTSLELF